MTHIGPENPIGSVPHASSELRYLNDVLFTYKASDKLTLLTEFNFIKDDGFHALAYGAAE
ncbi:MAG: hypothetical protein JWM91_1485, partial [Rhodospirillales bacterium]|nr:hypothetical protein [Rhodospirillales bacterium]